MELKKINEIEDLIAQLILERPPSTKTQRSVVLLTALQLSNESTRIICDLEEYIAVCRNWDISVLGSVVSSLSLYGLLAITYNRDSASNGLSRIYRLTDLGIAEANSLLDSAESAITVPQQPDNRVSVAIDSNSKMNTVFIGHGKVPFHMVHTHLNDEFVIQIQTFERNKIAGRQVVEILEYMLTESDFAVIVATAEDEAVDGTRARQNVVHEIGLFQGRLGFTKVAVLMEKGLKSATNLSGVLLLEFEPGKIEQTWADLDKTLRKSGFQHR